MPELTVTGMRVVSEVGARGSFTAAARALGYTQSAVSRQVAIAEQAVGAPLFQREARGVRPTPRGALLLRHVGAILARIDAAAIELAAFGETLSDTVRIGAFPTALAVLVPRALARVGADHPGLEIRIREGGSAAQLRRLHAGRVHVAVVSSGGGLEWDLDGLRVDPLLYGEPLLVVSREHRLAGRTWVDVGELAREKWIVGEGDGSGPQFGPWPTVDEEVEVVHSARDWISRLGLVAAGLGVAVIPSLMVDALPPGVHALRVEDPRPFRRELLAVTGPQRSPAVQAVIDALREESGELTRATRP